MGEAIEQAREAVMLDRLEWLASELVGQAGVENAQNCLKRAMLTAALQQTGGNFARAAELLGVRRQAIQQMVSRYGLKDWAGGLRRETRRVTPW